MPELYVIAGANGAGKSTISKSLAQQVAIPIVDPDAIAYELAPNNPTKVTLQAGRAAIARTQKYVETSTSFGVETTLAGRNYLKLMKSLKQVGWHVNLVYIGIDNPETNIRRVKERVSRGGHDVPIKDVWRRYDRSLNNLPIAIALADSVILYDNSTQRFSLIVTIEGGNMLTHVKKNPSWCDQIVNGLQ
jgi:predicted ABC-type ATPase